HRGSTVLPAGRSPLSPAPTMPGFDPALGWRQTFPYDSLETLQFRERQLAFMHVHGAKLRATVQRGNILARIQQPLFVEGRLDFVEKSDFVIVELDAHLVDFFAPHPVFPRNAAAHFHTQ